VGRGGDVEEGEGGGEGGQSERGVGGAQQLYKAIKRMTRKVMLFKILQNSNLHVVFQNIHISETSSVEASEKFPFFWVIFLFRIFSFNFSSKFSQNFFFSSTTKKFLREFVRI
jgi:hypothetical protein